MSEKIVAVIFEEKPKQWGLRGDPYLWEDMKQAFSTVRFPISEEEFIIQFNSYFLAFTGVPLSRDCHVAVASYPINGMSSGQISGSFWIDKALPLLLDRLKEQLCDCVQ